MSRFLLLLRFLRHFVRVVRDPSKLDQILELISNLTDADLIQPITDFFLATPSGSQAYRERPRVGRIDLDALGQLPPGSLGREFADHMHREGLDPDAIPQLPATTDNEYTLAHLHEVHDIWHVVTGFGTDTAGELGLQAFDSAQFPSRLGITLVAAGLLNALIYDWEDRHHRMDEISRGWQLGRRTPHFFGVDWAAQWSRPLRDIQAELGLAPRLAA